MYIYIYIFYMCVFIYIYIYIVCVRACAFLVTHTRWHITVAFFSTAYKHLQTEKRHARWSVQQYLQFTTSTHTPVLTCPPPPPCVCCRTRLRKASSRGTSTEPSPLTTTSRTLTETDRTPSTRSARWPRYYIYIYILHERCSVDSVSPWPRGTEGSSSQFTFFHAVFKLFWKPSRWEAHSGMWADLGLFVPFFGGFLLLALFGLEAVSITSGGMCLAFGVGSTLWVTADVNPHDVPDTSRWTETHLFFHFRRRENMVVVVIM